MAGVSKRTLREWRAYRKFDKNHMARKVGVHPSTYDKWEKSPEEIKIRDAVRIAQILECDVGEIIFFENNPKFNLDIAISVS